MVDPPAYAGAVLLDNNVVLFSAAWLLLATLIVANIAATTRPPPVVVGTPATRCLVRQAPTSFARRMWISSPRGDAAAAPDAWAYSSTPLATILLVEDEPAIRQLMSAALERAGYRVVQAKNGGTL